MNGFSRFAIAAVLVAGLGDIASAQSQRGPVGQDQYNALYEGGYGVVAPAVRPSGVVPPSESHTVMGLRVPR